MEKAKDAIITSKSFSLVLQNSLTLGQNQLGLVEINFTLFGDLSKVTHCRSNHNVVGVFHYNLGNESGRPPVTSRCPSAWTK